MLDRRRTGWAAPPSLDVLVRLRTRSRDRTDRPIALHEVAPSCRSALRCAPRGLWHPGSVNIVEQARLVATREDLAAFVLAVRDGLAGGSTGWENLTLERFLEAFAAWCTDTAGDHPAEPTWRLVAEMFGAASMYE